MTRLRLTLKDESKIEELNESKLRLEAEKNKSQIEIEWFKARADKAFKEARSEQDAKRTEIQLLQLYDNNPYNDKVVQDHV